MGFAKAFELASLAQLQAPISRSMGVVWLAAGILVLAAAVALFTARRWFWLLAALGLVASQIAIVSAWSDAGFGTIANVVILAAAVYGAFAWGPFGRRAD